MAVMVIKEAEPRVELIERQPLVSLMLTHGDAVCLAAELVDSDTVFAIDLRKQLDKATGTTS